MRILNEIYVFLRLFGIKIFSMFGKLGIPVVIEGLNEADERIVRLAEEKIRRMGVKAKPELVKALNRKSTLVKWRVTKLLRSYPSDDAVRPLSMLINHQDEILRKEAIATLGKLGQQSETAIPSLILTLKDPALSVRQEAKSTLKSIGPPAQKALLDALQISAKTDGELSYQISGVLSLFGKNAVSDLIGFIKDGNTAIEPYAMRSLKLLGHDAIPDLVELFNDRDSHIRWTAIKILEMMDRKAKDTIPALCTLLSDSDENVRFRAGFALGVIGADPSIFEPVLEKLAPPLGKYEAYGLYWDHSTLRAHITKEYPIVGEVFYDRYGRRFLTPEKDDRGGQGGSISLLGVVVRTSRYGSELVEVSGFYEKESGILVTSVADAE